MDTTTSKPPSGGSAAYKTGKEIPISASTTLTAATHGGKTLEICMTEEGQTVTLPSGVGLTTKQRRIGFIVSPRSQSFAVKNAGTVNTDQVLEAVLGPGAAGSFYANALTVTADWVWTGHGQLKALWKPGSPSPLYDSGAQTNYFGSFTPPRGRSSFLNGGDGFALTYAHTNNIYAVVATFDANKTITWGSQQTVRDTAATFKDPALGAASGGGLVFAWWDSTNSKIEVVGASVDLGARTISVGSVVDLNATSTIDPNSDRRIGVFPDAATANQMFITTVGTNEIINQASLSGNTLTLDGDNVATGVSGCQRFAPSAANKIIGISISSFVRITQYQYTAGAMSADWSYVLNSGTSITSGDGILRMSDTRYFGSVRGQVTVFETDAGSTQITKFTQYGPGLPLTSQGTFETTQTLIGHSLALDENHILFAPYSQASSGPISYCIADVRDLSVVNTSSNGAGPRTLKVNSVDLTNGSEGQLHALAVHPTTKDVLIGIENYRASGGNMMIQVVLLETPRNM